jgi:hypothetical protein
VVITGEKSHVQYTIDLWLVDLAGGRAKLLGRFSFISLAFCNFKFALSSPNERPDSPSATKLRSTLQTAVATINLKRTFPYSIHFTITCPLACPALAWIYTSQSLCWLLPSYPQRFELISALSIPRLQTCHLNTFRFYPSHFVSHYLVEFALVF